MTTRSPVWLIDLQIGGRLERFATRPVVVVNDAGRALAYREGLGEVALDLAAEVAGGEISTAISISANWLEGLQVGSAGWSLLVASWHRLEGASAVLRRWFPGSTFEGARVMLRGDIQEVEHGGRAEPLTFTLRRNLFDGSRPLLKATERVDSTTWPIVAAPGLELDDKAIGSYYPRIFGTPGDITVTPATTPTPKGAVPAPLAQSKGAGPGQNNLIVVAVGEIEAVDVELWDFTEDPPEHGRFAVQLVEDNLGQLVSVVEISNPTTLRPEYGHAFYCGFSPAVGRGGGTLRPGGQSGLLDGLGEIAQFLLDRHTRADLVELDGRLDAWRLSTWYNEGGLDAWDWITRELGPLCPFRLFEGRLGLALRLFDWRAAPVDAVARFDVDLHQLERVSGVRSRPASGIANRIVIEYKRDRATDTYLERYTLDAEADPDDLDRTAGSYRAQVSQSRLANLDTGDDGVRELFLQVPHVSSQSVIALIASYLMAELALPAFEVTYKGPVGLEQRIDPCDVVLVNDTEVGFVDRVALVDRLTPRPSDTLLTLLVLDDPTTVQRPQL